MGFMRTTPRQWFAVLAAAAVLLAGLTATPATAAEPPPGATWSETYIDTPDGESLHVDVLRPEGYTDADQTPVILIASPYIGDVGPSNRFYDFIEGANVFERGYSVVMVSLRGTGGSSGCLDILGPGEQMDVVTGVEWAAAQPWSTGKVGMYGKSYDANTGAVGAALRPDGLAAVVAQQIAPDRYRGSYNDRVRLLQSLAYPTATYGVGAEQQISPDNDTTYLSNSLGHSADCQVGLAPHYLDDPTADFWTVRDFVERAEGSTVPTFITTGYLDNPTNIGAGALDLYNALDGPKKLWVGWWDHVRGNDMVEDRLAMGRQGFFDEVMNFYDRHLKGLDVGSDDPVIAAQGSDGTWRSEESFPPADAQSLSSPLLGGSYVDDARNLGSADSGFGPGGTGSLGEEKFGDGVWTFSPPLAHAAQLTGIPTATIDIAPQVPRTNLVVNVYDVDPAGEATLLTRGAGLVDAAGEKTIELWPTDWNLAAGHRVGVLVTGSNADAYTHVPTQTTATVAGGTIDLPFLRYERVSDLAGDPAPRLESYRERAPFPVAAETITSQTSEEFALPAPLESRTDTEPDCKCPGRGRGRGRGPQRP